MHMRTQLDNAAIPVILKLLKIVSFEVNMSQV